MTTISLILPNDGETIDASDVNGPFNAIASVLNGNLDSTNIASLNGSKLLAGSVPDTALAATAGNGWVSLAVVPTITASNGQKENVLQFAGVDYTSILQKGTKLRIPRTSTVPTQSAKFIAASSQYANKTTPAGMTFTDNFTVEGWINPASYVEGWIGGRLDVGATTGFIIRMVATGQIELLGWNGAGNKRTGTTYQSVPLNKRTHIAATWATGTVLIYLDGVLVLSLTATAGTAPTTITQGTDFAIGRGGAFTTNCFNGEVSDFRIHSVVKTAAQIRDNMGKQLVGNEANLVGYWKLNGDFLDSTANANHLTAQAGAVATTVGHAFSPIEYVIVTSTPVFAAGNTTCTVFTGNGVLPNETLGATSYSGQRAPFGFPAERNKWLLQSLYKLTGISQASPVASNWYNLASALLTLPMGDWAASYSTVIGASVGSGNNSTISTLSTTTNTDVDTINWTSENLMATTTMTGQNTRSGYLSPTVMTPYYLLNGSLNIVTSIFLNSDKGITKITAESTLL